MKKSAALLLVCLLLILTACGTGTPPAASSSGTGLPSGVPDGAIYLPDADYTEEQRIALVHAVDEVLLAYSKGTYPAEPSFTTENEMIHCVPEGSMLPAQTVVTDLWVQAVQGPFSWVMYLPIADDYLFCVNVAGEFTEETMEAEPVYAYFIDGHPLQAAYFVKGSGGEFAMLSASRTEVTAEFEGITVPGVPIVLAGSLRWYRFSGLLEIHLTEFGRTYWFSVLDNEVIGTLYISEPGEEEMPVAMDPMDDITVGEMGKGMLTTVYNICVAQGFVM